MLWNLKFDSTCWSQLATSTLVNVTGIFSFKSAIYKTLLFWSNILLNRELIKSQPASLLQHLMNLIVMFTFPPNSHKSQSLAMHVIWSALLFHVLMKLTSALELDKLHASCNYWKSWLMFPNIAAKGSKASRLTFPAIWTNIELTKLSSIEIIVFHFPFIRIPV